MPRTTKKFQVTIPKHVREKINLKPGEELEAFALNDNEILLKRKVKRVRNPLEILLGKERVGEVSPGRLDELAEN